ncbi:phenylacetate--CoA ligase family protein [Actinophytocola sp.]|uniref:phenylacetate--CoA ligase family protein n=1 Tax=Actinophytocola sp. TaxID=1872138 RepID=UPI003899C1B4
MFTVYHPESAELTARLWDQHVELLAGRWDPRRLAEHQAELFRTTVSYVRERSTFYRSRLAGVRLADDGPLTEAELASIPFTSKADLREAQFDLLSRPVPAAWIFYETTGTTGAATPCPRDNVDSVHNNTVLTEYYRTVFGRFGDAQVIGVAGPSELHATGDTFGDVCRNLGLAVAKMWPHSPMIGFPRALEVMRLLPVTGLFCTPGMALALAKKARESGLDTRADFHLDVLMLTGELASPGLLANIGELWGATAHNALYASQEASVLAAVTGDGSLSTAPLINYYEVVDPVTLAPTPADASGVRQGELVVTNLYQGAKPLVRYRTGDLVRMYPAAAGAAAPVPTLEVLGRVRDELVLNDHPVTGYDLENLLLRHVRGYLDYQVVLDRGTTGADRVTLVLQGDVDPTDPALAATVEDCARELGVELLVSFGDPGAITGTGAMVSWKAARVVDRRSPDDHETRVAHALAARRA